MERQSGTELHVDSTVVPQHHRALAGGSSISQLQNNHPRLLLTPPGFSRWFFNFLATKVCQNSTFFLPEKLKYHRLKPGGVQEGWQKLLLSQKLNHHRVKPGGV